MSTVEKLLASIGGVALATFFIVGGLSWTHEGIEYGETLLFVLGAVLLVTVCSVIVFLALHFAVMRYGATKTQMLVAAIVGVLAGGGVSGYIAMTTPARPSYDDAFWDNARAVCNGIGIPEAPAYTETPGQHRVVAIGPDGEVSWTRSVPTDWLPSSLEDLELVVCLGPDEFFVVEMCQYVMAGGITRYQHEREFTLRSAHTALVVASGRFQGAPPEDCPARRNSDSDRAELHGSAVGIVGNARDWLGLYVNR